jgi:hypothetical protein
MAHRDTTESRRFKIRYIVYGLLLILLGWLVFFRISVHSDLAQRLQALSEAGYALSLAELTERNVLPEGADNAADYYLTAFSHYSEPNEKAHAVLPWAGKAKQPRRTEPVDEAMRQAIEVFLSDNEKTLILLHEAVALKHAQYPMDFGQGPDMSLPWLKAVRRSAFLLSLEGLCACAQADPNRAMETVRATLALAESLDCPLLINRLVQISVRTLACRNIEQVVSRLALSDEQLQRLAGWLETYTDEEGYRQALIGERCFGLSTFRAPGGISSHMGGGKVLSAILIPMKILGLHERDMLGYVNLMQDYIDALELPEGERLAAYQAVEKKLGSGKSGGLLTQMLMPALQRTYQLEMRHIANRRVAHTALAVERYRLAQGTLPKALDELVPTYLDEVPIDPFDGQALRYTLLAKGYVVYSMGEDGSDDGGTERDKENRHPDGTPQWDVTFFVER